MKTLSYSKKQKTKPINGIDLALFKLGMNKAQFNTALIKVVKKST